MPDDLFIVPEFVEREILEKDFRISAMQDLLYDILIETGQGEEGPWLREGTQDRIRAFVDGIDSTSVL